MGQKRKQYSRERAFVNRLDEYQNNQEKYTILNIELWFSWKIKENTVSDIVLLDRR